MNQKLLKNTTYITIGKILPQIINLVFIPFYTKYLGAANYGKISTLLVLSQILIIVCTLSFDRCIFRLYYEYTGNEKRIFLGTVLISSLGVCLIFSVLSLLLGLPLFNIFIKDIPFFPFYIIVQILSIVTSLSNIPITLMQVEQKIKEFVILHLVQFIVDVILKIIFLIILRLNIAWVLSSTIFSYLIIWPFLWKYYFSRIEFKFKKQYFLNALSFSAPMLPSLLSAWILNMSDRFFIQMYFTMEEVGIYSLGYKLASYVTVLATAFYTAYNPIFYRIANEEKEKKHELIKYNTIYLIITIASSSFLMCFSKEIIMILFDEIYYRSYRVIQIIAFSYIFSLMTGLKNLSLYQDKKNVLNMVIVILSAALNVLTNLLLIPRYGIYGAAFSTILCFIFQYLAKKYYSDKGFQNKVDKKYLIYCLSILVLLFVLSEISNIFILNIYITLIIKAIIFILIWGVLIIKNEYFKEYILSIVKRK